MKYLILPLLLLALPAHASLGTQECLQLIRDYWTEFDKTGVEPADLYEKFGLQCEASKELDDLMLHDEYINEITARMAKKGLI